MNKILVLGVGKSGTTALYYLIKAHLTSKHVSIYEPKNSINSAKFRENPVLAKVLVTGSTRPEKIFHLFDKIVFIVRDPRDILISRLLYRHAIHEPNRARVHSLLLNLKEKSKNPSSLPFYQLVEEEKIQDYVNEIEKRLRQLSILIKNYPDAFVLSYKHLIDKKFSDLGDYLNLSLLKQFRVHPRHGVERSKQYNNWKHWFLEEDLNYFKQYFSEFMHQFGFNDFELAPLQIISDELSYKFVIRTHNKRYFYRQRTKLFQQLKITKFVKKLKKYY